MLTYTHSKGVYRVSHIVPLHTKHSRTRESLATNLFYRSRLKQIVNRRIPYEAALVS